MFSIPTWLLAPSADSSTGNRIIILPRGSRVNLHNLDFLHRACLNNFLWTRFL